MIGLTLWGMAWTTTDDIEEFLAVAGGFLRSRPVENTLLLTVTSPLSDRGPGAFGQAAPRFGWWRPVDGTVGCAFLQTPPHPLLLTAAPPPVAASLAATLPAGPALPGVNADQAAAEAFAAQWHRRTGVVWQLRRYRRLYRLGDLVVPRPAPPGNARVAGADDRDVLLAWHEAFTRELGEVPGRLAEVVDDRISYGGLTLWEVDGQAVAMAGCTRPVAGMVRVAPVYAPPELRRRGYAAAVTAAVSRAARDAGADKVVLFADLANPASNALYQRLGYQPVGDSVVLCFEA